MQGGATRAVPHAGRAEKPVRRFSSLPAILVYAKIIA